MTDAYPPLSVPASPEYFRTLLTNDAFPDAMPADDYAAFVNDLSWDGRQVLRDQLSGCFPEHVTITGFDSEFPTLRGRTVGDVCQFLADRVPRPVVRPWLNDRTAGAFLTIRHQLATDGADVTEVRPSAPLESYLRRHPQVFNDRLHRLAPRLPFVRPHRPVERAGITALFGSFFLMLALLGVGYLLGDHRPGMATVGFLCLGLPLAAVVTVVGALLPPRRVTLGDLVTFRDLARAVAVQQPA